MRVQQPCDRFVRFHHEHLDQRMREALVFRRRADDFALFIQHQFDLRQIEHKLPIVPGRRFWMRLASAFISCSKLDNRRRIIGDRLSGRRDAESIFAPSIIACASR